MPTSQDHTSMTVPAAGRSRRRGTRLRVAAAIVAAVAVSAPVLAPAAIAAKKGGKTGGARGAYRGKTAQGLPVTLSKAVKGARRFTYQATMTCSDGTTFTDKPFVDLVKIKKGKFRVRFKSDKGATVTNVRGAIKGKKASGTVHITERYGASPNASGNFPLDPHGTTFCQSSNVKWTAKAK